MARRRIADKQQAILDAAIEVFAARGFWDTPTSLISKTAGVADGTLFNYFKTKDDLICEVYLKLKRELAKRLVDGMAAHTTFREKLRYGWHEYINWALENPAKFAVLQQIGTSFDLSDEVKAAGMEPFVDLQELASQRIAVGELQEYPVDYLATVLEGLVVATIRFFAQQPQDRAQIIDVGFEILWNGIVR
jgi:AcrR family transcriptional regulator